MSCIQAENRTAISAGLRRTSGFISISRFPTHGQTFRRVLTCSGAFLRRRCRPCEASQKAIGSFGKLVVIGSTSAYDVGRSHEYPPPWIDEHAPIDLSKPRVQGEEFLRNECGAVVLRVAGIYGPGRNPYEWIKSGRVRLSDKYVNLIHAEDLAETCVAALQCGRPGAAYNVSDGVPRTWREIGRQLYGNPPAQEPTGEQRAGKRISTVKLRSMLQEAGTSIRHPDIFRSLERLP
jgi:dTDP-4-dehydrorhamnose reductase